jgi:hypothetical protein
MATMKQKRAGRANIKKAAAASKRKRTLKKLPKSTRSAMGKRANQKKRTRAG